jgi:DNA-binding transcriptional LysR family regulator
LETDIRQFDLIRPSVEFFSIMISPTLELDLLRTLVLAVDVGSFKQAASIVGRTQSAVSLQMRRLESQVGVPIFQRIGKKLNLTENGVVLLDYARKLLALNDEAIQAAAGTKLHGRLRLGLLQDFAESILPKSLAAFSRAQPGVEMHVRTESSVKLLELLHRRELDLAVYFASRNLASKFQEIRVAKLPMVWVFQEQQRPASPWSLVLFEPPCVFRDAAVATFKERRWRQTFSSPSLAGTWAAVSAGLGISVRTPIGVPSGLRVQRQLPGLGKLPNVDVVIAQSSESEPVQRLRQVLDQTLKTWSAGFAIPA